MAETYSTSDFPAAAFLLANREKMNAANRDGRRVTFVFTETGQCKELVKKYMFGEDQVSARAFHEASKRLKHIIYDVLGQQSDQG